MALGEVLVEAPAVRFPLPPPRVRQVLRRLQRLLLPNPLRPVVARLLLRQRPRALVVLRCGVNAEGRRIRDLLPVYVERLVCIQTPSSLNAWCPKRGWFIG